MLDIKIKDASQRRLDSFEGAKIRQAERDIMEAEQKATDEAYLKLLYPKALSWIDSRLTKAASMGRESLKIESWKGFEEAVYTDSWNEDWKITHENSFSYVILKQLTKDLQLNGYEAHLINYLGYVDDIHLYVSWHPDKKGWRKLWDSLTKRI